MFSFESSMFCLNREIFFEHLNIPLRKVDNFTSFIQDQFCVIVKMPLRSGKVLTTVKEENVPIKIERKNVEKLSVHEIQVAVKQEDPNKAVKAEKNKADIKQEVKQEPGNEPDKSENVEPVGAKATKRFDDNNKPFWELGRNRRLFLSVYKGVEYVHIREFYTEESSGETFQYVHSSEDV